MPRATAGETLAQTLSTALLSERDRGFFLTEVNFTL
jgi:hypothetical protein